MSRVSFRELVSVSPSVAGRMIIKSANLTTTAAPPAGTPDSVAVPPPAGTPDIAAPSWTTNLYNKGLNTYNDYVQKPVTDFVSNAATQQALKTVQETWDKNPWLQYATAGAGLGGALGLGSGLFGRKKRPLSGLLGGALLGGAAAGGFRGLYDTINAPATSTPAPSGNRPGSSAPPGTLKSFAEEYGLPSTETAISYPYNFIKGMLGYDTPQASGNGGGGGGSSGGSGSSDGSSAPVAGSTMSTSHRGGLQAMLGLAAAKNIYQAARGGTIGYHMPVKPEGSPVASPVKGKNYGGLLNTLGGAISGPITALPIVGRYAKNLPFGIGDRMSRFDPRLGKVYNWAYDIANKPGELKDILKKTPREAKSLVTWMRDKIDSSSLHKISPFASNGPAQIADPKNPGKYKVFNSSKPSALDLLRKAQPSMPQKGLTRRALGKALPYGAAYAAGALANEYEGNRTIFESLNPWKPQAQLAPSTENGLAPGEAADNVLQGK